MLLNGPSAVPDLLWRAAKCDSQVGLRDHAAVPLRAAVRAFRELAGDPRLAAALIALGNALRKSSPAEAESCYQEAAQYHESRAQLESAAPAWVNLGVMCSEQGRFAESLAYYEKALHVREKTACTPPARMGTLLNNIANVLRRMGQFEEAIRTVERAHAPGARRWSLLCMRPGHSRPDLPRLGSGCGVRRVVSQVCRRT